MKTTDEKTTVDKTMFVDICKIDTTRHTLLGIALVPEVVDLQGDIMSADVIEKAAHDFLMWSRETRIQHIEGYVEGLHVVESYIAPSTFSIDTRKIKKGTWLVKMLVTNENLWALIKQDKLTGFSIGGKAETEEAIG